jgi:hypothetical protein
MVEGKDALEGGYRMMRIQRTKIYLYAVQLVLILAIVIFLLNAEGGFSLKPFYLPLDSFIYFVILMLLLFNIEGCFFRGLEMRVVKTDSAKYYMTKRSISRGLVIIAISALVIVILWVPAISDGVESVLSESGEIDGVRSFYNKDPLGLTTTSGIAFTCEGEAYVYVVTEENFLTHSGNMDQLRFYRINSNDYIVNPSTSFTFPDSDYGKYYMVIDYRFSSVDTVQYTVNQTISTTFTSYVPLFAIFFIIVNVGWLTYLLPMKKRYSAKAIYR